MEQFTDYVKQFFSQMSMSVIFRIIGVLIALLIGFKLVKLVCRLVEKAMVKKNVDPSVISFVRSFLNIALKVLVILTCISILGISMSAISAVIAAVGLAIGLALQGSLSNFAGGLMILLFKPFKVGEYVKSGDDEGFVTDITIFYTTLRTHDNRKIMLPNGKLSDSSVTNYSAMEDRRVDIDFQVAMDSDMEQVKKVMLDTANANPMVLKDPAAFARLTKYEESSLVFTMRAWCKNEDYWDVMFDLNEQIKAAFDKNGIVIPFPQIDVHSK